ncbi:MAG TPA: 16S rRNA (uracil(1498)-N(3))-methyltransferase [Clostridia bacterium]|nr:16S rRNA (uracil(1498)-N(3))-methyltransferase [Clostridia bacterium]
MNRVFVLPSDIKDEKVIISGSEAYHLRKVLRSGPGDRIQVADGNGNEFLAEIVEVNEKILCRVVQRLDSNPEPEVKVVLWQSIPKGDKMDFIIQKCTELGVAEINPVYSKYTIVKLNQKKEKEREKRWQRIAHEAAKQCRRSVIPVINPIKNWQEITLFSQDKCLYLMFAETEKENSLRKLLELNPYSREIHLLVGPEGGFAPEEIKIAQEKGWHPVTLGRRILRTETAGMAGLTMVLYHFGQIGG